MHCMFCAPFLASRSLPKLTQSVGTYLLETVCSQSMKLLSLEKSLEQANLIHCVYISNFILRKFQQTLIEHTCTRGTPKIPVWKWFRKHKQLVFRVVLGMFWSFLRFVQLALRLASSNYLTSCLPRMNSRQFQSSSARRDGEWCCNVTVQMSKCACRTAKGSCGGNRGLLLFNDDVRLNIRWIFHQKGSVYCISLEFWSLPFSQGFLSVQLPSCEDGQVVWTRIEHATVSWRFLIFGWDSRWVYCLNGSTPINGLINGKNWSEKKTLLTGVLSPHLYLFFGPTLSMSLVAVDQGSGQTLSWGLGRPRGYVPKQLSVFFIQNL